MPDLPITDATVLDGTGRPGFPADVAVTGGRVVEVGRLAGQQATRATGS
jgi:N-acyl-D-amino-acid deacylase